VLLSLVTVLSVDLCNIQRLFKKINYTENY